MRRLPILISLGIVIVAFVSFWFYKENRLAYLARRDFRLVAVATQALKESLDTLSADKQIVTVRRSGASITVDADAPVGRDFTTDCVPYRDPECRFHYHSTITIDEALSEVPERGGFEGVVVFDGRGQFVARRDFTRRGHPFLSLAGEGENAAKGKTAAAGDDDQTSRVQQFTRGSATATVDLAGEPHRLFCEPFSLSGPPPETLVFCGVMPEAAFQAEARATSPFVLGLFAVALLVTLLAQPILKLVLLAPHARVAFADVFTIGVCTFVILVTLTITILTAGVESQLRRDEDERLDTLGAAIRKHVKDEIGLAVRQVQEVDGALFELPRVAPSPKSPPLPLVVSLSGACVKTPCGYPYLDRVFWAEQGGWEVARWTQEDDVVRQPVGLETRRYFREVRDGGGWHLPKVDTRFYLQTVRMRTSAKKAVVVSLRSKTAERLPTAAEAAISPVVVAGVTQLLSSWNPVLPADTGFAVIDDDGSVVLHNRPSEVLSHNLFTETDDSATLAAEVRARRGSALDVRYWGESHRFWVSPLWPGSPLTLVVFRPYAALRAVAVEVTEEAAIVSAVYFLLAFVVSLSFFAIRGPNLSWLWPTAERTGTYAGLCATYAFLAGGFALALARWHEEECLLAGMLLPLAALGLTAVLFSGSRARRSRTHCVIAVAAVAASLALAAWQSSLYVLPALVVAILVAAAIVGWRSLAEGDAPRAQVLVKVAHWVRALHLQRYEARVLFPYCLACVAFWALFTMIPTFAVVKGASERAIRRLARHEVLAYTAARNARDRAIDEKYRRGWLRTVAAKRKAEELDLYPPTSITSTPPAPFESVRPPALRPAGALYKEIADALDRKWVLSSFGKNLRALGDGTAGGGSWITGRGQEWFQRLDSDALYVVEPRFDHFVGFPILAGLVFTLLVPLAAWVHWSAHHIFLGAIGNPCRRTLQEVVRDGPVHACCVLPSRSTWRRALTHASVELIDPDDPRSEARLPASGPIAIDALPSASAQDWEWRRRANVLERALRSEYAVIVFSATPPLVTEPSLSRAATASAASAAHAENEWLAILGRLSLVWLRTPLLSMDEARARAGALGHEDGDIREFVAEEIHASPELAFACESLPKNTFADFRREDLAAHLASLGAPAYMELWSACTPEEKLTLLQVAQEGVINPGRTEAVRSLLNKGLLRRRPELVVMNESFRRFLATVPDRAAVLALESVRSGAFSWDDVRLPLLTAGGVAAFVVFSTERQVFDSTLLFVSTVSATALPAFSRVVTSLGTRMAKTSGSDPATPA
jgi:hypothetical protein